MRFNVIVVALFLFICNGISKEREFDVEEFLQLKANANHYSIYYGRNYIPIRLTNSNHYEFMVIRNEFLERFVRTKYLTNTEHLSRTEYEKLYDQFIKRRINNGYIELEFDSILEFFKLSESYFASGKDVVGSFIKKGVKITDEKYRNVFKCFSLGRYGMVADKKCNPNLSPRRADVKFYLYSLGYIISEGDFLPILSLSEREE